MLLNGPFEFRMVEKKVEEVDTDDIIPPKWKAIVLEECGEWVTDVAEVDERKCVLS